MVGYNNINNMETYSEWNQCQILNLIKKTTHVQLGPYAYLQWVSNVVRMIKVHSGLFNLNQTSVSESSVISHMNAADIY